MELAEARVGGGDSIQWEHLLHRIRIAEEHHDFLEMRTAHVPFPDLIAAPRRAAPLTCRMATAAPSI
jgi:hypothetical protein